MAFTNGYNPHHRSLSSLKRGEEGIIDSLETPNEVSLKLMEMGIGPGERIRFIRKSPFGDPRIFELLNYRLALRKSESDKIFLKTTPSHPQN